MNVPETHYACSGDLQIAYQVVGEGPLDIVLVPSYLSNIELFWELPAYARFLRAALVVLAGDPVRPARERDVRRHCRRDTAGGADRRRPGGDRCGRLRAAGAALVSRGLRLDGAVRGLPPGAGAGARPAVAAASPGGGTGIRVGAERRAARCDRSRDRRLLGRRLAREPVGHPCWPVETTACEA